MTRRLSGGKGESTFQAKAVVGAEARRQRGIVDRGILRGEEVYGAEIVKAPKCSAQGFVLLEERCP